MCKLPPKTQEQYWSEEGGDIWLHNLQNFESMIAPVGQFLIGDSLENIHKKVIDVGCGGGATTFMIAEAIGADGSIIGIDISRALINNCLDRAKNQAVGNIQFICGDAASIELPRAWADLIISRFGVMFFKDPESAFSHIGQSLRPSGKLSFSCWGPLSENPWMNILLTILGKHTQLPEAEPRSPGPFAYSDRDYIWSILTSAGYKSIELKVWSGDLLIGTPGMSPKDAAQFLFSSSSLVRRIKNKIADREERIFDEFVRELEAYVKNDGVWMPAKSWIVSATR